MGRLHTHLASSLPYSFRITVTNTASTDGTAAIADWRSDLYADLDVLHLREKARGRALKAALAQSRAKVLAYRNVDLSTDLVALLPLIVPLLTGHSDVAIGSRLARGPAWSGARSASSPPAPTTRCFSALCRPISPTHNIYSTPSALMWRSNCYR